MAGILIIAFAIVAIIVVLLFLFLVIYFRFWKKRKTPSTSLPLTVGAGEHFILPKGDSLLEILKNVAKNRAGLKKEFKDMEDYVRENIKEPTNLAKTDTNKQHNRYSDMVPFDNNVVKLQKTVGKKNVTFFLNC